MIVYLSSKLDFRIVSWQYKFKTPRNFMHYYFQVATPTTLQVLESIHGPQVDTGLAKFH